MRSQPRLLDDTAIQYFIVNGYLSVRPSLPADYHPALKGQLDDLIGRDGNPGNDLVTKVPDLEQLFADPALDGALQSLLGPGYILHRHCHCHDLKPDTAEQSWHKDYSIGGHPRCHRGRWALLFYYPQAVTAAMGPTAVQPCSQYNMEPVPESDGTAFTCEAGTVVIAHYDIWHKATAHTGDQTRYMLKFLFARRTEPDVPSWDAHDPAWTPPQGEHRTLWRHLWHWYRGDENPTLAKENARVIPTWTTALKAQDPRSRRQAADALGSVRAASAVPALVACLQDTDETVRLNAAYALGAQGAVDELALALRQEAVARWQDNLDRGDYTAPSQLDATYGLAAAGAPAVAVLIEELTDEAWPIRAAAATALGYIGRSAAPALPALAVALSDDNEWVRRQAAEALGYIGPQGDLAVQALIAALDDHRSVSRWSLSTDPFRESVAAALARMAPLSPEVIQALSAVRNDGEYVSAWATSGLARG